MFRLETKSAGAKAAASAKAIFGAASLRRSEGWAAERAALVAAARGLNGAETGPFVAAFAPAYIPALVRIAISPAAFAAISSTLSVESVSFEAEPGEKGERLIWLNEAVVDRLAACAGRGRATAT